MSHLSVSVVCEQIKESRRTHFTIGATFMALNTLNPPRQLKPWPDVGNRENIGHS